MKQIYGLEFWDMNELLNYAQRFDKNLKNTLDKIGGDIEEFGAEFDTDQDVYDRCEDIFARNNVPFLIIPYFDGRIRRRKQHGNGLYDVDDADVVLLLVVNEEECRYLMAKRNGKEIKQKYNLPKNFPVYQRFAQISYMDE